MSDLKNFLDSLGCEDEHTEFKEAKNDFSITGSQDNRQCIYAYSVAIANEGGGCLVLGVDDNKHIVGTKFSSDKFSITYPPTWKKVLQNNSVGSKTTISLMIEENLNDENKPVSSINIIISNKKWNEPTSYLAKKSHEEIKKYDYKCNFISIDDCILSGYKGSVLKQTIVLNGFKYLQYH